MPLPVPQISKEQKPLSISFILVDSREETLLKACIKFNILNQETLIPLLYWENSYSAFKILSWRLHLRKIFFNHLTWILTLHYFNYMFIYESIILLPHYIRTALTNAWWLKIQAWALDCLSSNLKSTTYWLCDRGTFPDLLVPALISYGAICKVKVINSCKLLSTTPGTY